MPYKPNKYVESWGTNREHIELTYKWDAVRVPMCHIFIFTVDNPTTGIQPAACHGHALERCNLRGASNCKADHAGMQDTWWTIGKWVVAFPVVIYTITKWEYNKSDRLFNREQRKFM